ncbi:MAG: hypothetical protein J0H73_14280 [Salana multivorans]|uniref:hypothetical protein n=1 Tax=Salana multivorans TaxID=120377 RepID=UPI000B06145B|nr:hypothetical protein [Salana multivorans]MBN8883468.1 hypothetical protein [Salana multivorans]
MTQLHPAATTPGALFTIPATTPPPERDTSPLPALAHHRPQCFPITCRCGAWILEQLLPYRMTADPALIPDPATEWLILATGATTYTLIQNANRPFALNWRWTGTSHMRRIPAPAGTALALPEHRCDRKPPPAWVRIDIQPKPPAAPPLNPPF